MLFAEEFSSVIKTNLDSKEMMLFLGRGSQEKGKQKRQEYS